MTQELYKAVFVNKRGVRWSVMNARKGFYHVSDVNLKSPLKYVAGKPTVPKDGRPYLFAFESIADAKRFLNCVFGPAIGIGFLKSGRIEIWKVQAEITQLTDKQPHELPISSVDWLDSWVKANSPHGTVFCSSITLDTKVDSWHSF